MHTPFLRFFGWSAWLNALTTTLVIVTIILFYTVGGPWGLINDAVSVLWMLSYLPLALLFYRLNRPAHPARSLISAIAGILAMIAFALMQVMLVVGAVNFLQTISAILAVCIFVGLWMWLNGRSFVTSQLLPSFLSRSIRLCGIGLTTAAAGCLLAVTTWGGSMLAVAITGAIVGGIGSLLWLSTVLVWPIQLGRLLFDNTSQNQVVFAD